MSAAPDTKTGDFKVRDMSLADWGRKELDIAELCKMIDTPQPRSLLDASISAIRGERAVRDGDRTAGTKLWASALAAAHTPKAKSCGVAAKLRAWSGLKPS